MKISGTQIHYYFICKRKLWLYVNEITMETNSDIVYEGKLIHENSYEKRNE
ncbi:MAG: Dna2/Cas4 domain-containing protein, partial [Leptospiraceae bacterium]|nr:Dna2/Cas4 domain-containing protein [Leptospiraceae bacterium]